MQVLTRYLLHKLFGPGVAGVTSDQTILYTDLPSNMVCPSPLACSLAYTDYQTQVLSAIDCDIFTKEK